MLEFLWQKELLLPWGSWRQCVPCRVAPRALPAQEEGASGWFRQQVWEVGTLGLRLYLAQTVWEPGRCQKTLSSPGSSLVCHLVSLLCLAVTRMNH